MRFYNVQHRYYCGIDLHAQRMFGFGADPDWSDAAFGNQVSARLAAAHVVAPSRGPLGPAAGELFPLDNPGPDKC
jgi:hypothetical protein